VTSVAEVKTRLWQQVKRSPWADVINLYSPEDRLCSKNKTIRFLS